MRDKRKLFVLLVLLILFVAARYILPRSFAAILFYDEWIFQPIQAWRHAFFSLIPFSAGDLFYVTVFILLLATILRWGNDLFRFQKRKMRLWSGILRTMLILGFGYLLFLIGWGGNYYKVSLVHHWDLAGATKMSDSALVQFDNYLVGKLNELAGLYESRPFALIEKDVRGDFQRLTDRSGEGVRVKSSLFGNLMQYAGIQGYYNPWTGEAQVNSQLPTFMLPFVIAHEMAHQAGIASEEDANLLAYATGVLSDDPLFQYSAYFNVWLYASRQISRRDSLPGNVVERQLNSITLAHLKQWKELRDKYQSGLRRYSGDLYDGYLKFYHQKSGIASYNRVVPAAWSWEKQKQRFTMLPLP